ncbi:sensor histidine kinase [Sphingomonas corticis]|uniref:histidine kinase n=1 Tax=Sphingomonas corticis TaxID=2722791 RepID=A0ABX1CSW9_9SPHN|nr:sensor histidine kinase [Sphingomonas corticis]NJR80048.1 sensor histidine kinase [Sphingomonas corticis]
MADATGWRPTFAGHAARRLEAMFMEQHLRRTEGEAAAALAALRLARPRADGPAQRLVDRAIERMEGFGRSARLLSCSSEPCDIGLLLALLCREIVRGRGDGRIVLSLDLESVRVAATGARLLALIVHELVADAVERPLADGGRLEIRLVRRDGDLVLTVADDGGQGGDRPRGSLTEPGVSSFGSGGSPALSLVASLLRRFGGTVEREMAGVSTVHRVTLPVRRGSDRSIVDD